MPVAMRLSKLMTGDDFPAGVRVMQALSEVMMQAAQTPSSGKARGSGPSSTPKSEQESEDGAEPGVEQKKAPKARKSGSGGFLPF